MFAKRIYADAFSANDDTRFGGVHVDRYLLRETFDANVRNSCVPDLAANHAADLRVFGELIGVSFLVGGVPLGTPVFDVAHSKAVRMNFASHLCLLCLRRAFCNTHRDVRRSFQDWLVAPARTGFDAL